MRADREMTPEEFEAKRVFIGDALDAPGPMLISLWEFATRNRIPANVRVVYAGCGSHALALDWTED